MKKYRFIDLFAGIGGFHQALINNGAKCVFASEIDKECQRQYKDQFGIEVVGDINSNIEKIPKFDILCGGFPCQTFSKAGKREGFNDEIKGKLFFTIIEILKKHKECKLLLLENVKNLADNKDFWNVIQDELGKLDFYVTKKAIVRSPSDYGIPQNRDRVFILGIKKDLANDQITKQGEILYKNLEIDQYERKCTPVEAFSIIEYGSNEGIKKVISTEENKIIKAWELFKRNIIPREQIGAPIWLDYFGVGIDDDEAFFSTVINEKTPEWKIDFIKKNRNLYTRKRRIIDSWLNKYEKLLTKKIYRKFEWNCGAEYMSFKELIIQFRQSGLRIKRANFFPSLVAIVNTPIIWDYKINKYRRLTIREAAKLQSFDEKFNFICSERTTLKQLGNSVNVKVIDYFAKGLFALVKGENKKCKR